MALLLDLLSGLLLLSGVLLGISGALGLFRFPDVFARLHAAGVTDTLCAGAIISGLVLQAGFSLVSVKLLLILGFLWLTSPVASHALARAALHCGLGKDKSAGGGSSNC